MLSNVGYSDDALEAWSALGLDADVPFARAIASGEPVWALSRDEMDVFTGAPALDEAGWVSVPLRTPAGIHGALHVSLHDPKELTEAERRWLQSVVSQCALALERSNLYEEEQRLREQSESLQRTTAALSNALTSSDVADVVIAAVREGANASSAVLYELVNEREALRPLSASGVSQNGDGAPAEVSLDDSPELTRVVRRGGSWFEPRTPARRSSARGSPCRWSRVARPSASWSSAGPSPSRSTTVTTAFSAPWPARVRRPSTEHGTSSRSARSPRPSSAASCRHAAAGCGVQIAARYLPGTQGLDIGGDWFDAVELRDGRLGLVVGDVVGKGVHAAANMGQLRNALRAISVERLKPPSALARLDRLASDGLDSTFATVVYAVFDSAAGCSGTPRRVILRPFSRARRSGRAARRRAGAAARNRPRREVPAERRRSARRKHPPALHGWPRGAARTSIDDGIDALVTAMREDRWMPSRCWSTCSTSSSKAPIGRTTSRSWPRGFSRRPKPLDLEVASRERSLHLVRDAIEPGSKGRRCRGRMRRTSCSPPGRCARTRSNMQPTRSTTSSGSERTSPTRADRRGRHGPVRSDLDARAPRARASAHREAHLGARHHDQRTWNESRPREEPASRGRRVIQKIQMSNRMITMSAMTPPPMYTAAPFVFVRLPS